MKLCHLYKYIYIYILVQIKTGRGQPKRKERDFFLVWRFVDNQQQQSGAKAYNNSDDSVNTIKMKKFNTH